MDAHIMLGSPTVSINKVLAMTSINKLTQNTSVNDSDLFVVWDSANSATRSISGTTLQEFIDTSDLESGSYDPDTQTLTLVQSDGSTLEITGFAESSTQQNESGYLYLSGDGETDGSIRFSVGTDGFTDGIFEELELGVWQPATMEFGANSVFLGPRVAVASLGKYIITEERDSDNNHLHAHSDFDVSTGTTTSTAKIVRFYNDYYIGTVQGDDSGSFTGTTLEFAVTPIEANEMIKNLYIKTGDGGANADIRIVCRENDESGALLFDKVFSQSLFTNNTTVELEATGQITLIGGESLWLQATSDEEFTWLTDDTGLEAYLLIEVANFSEDPLVQFENYDDQVLLGLEFTAGESYQYYENKLYVCNTSGTQTGTFEDNIALWDLLGADSGGSDENYDELLSTGITSGSELSVNSSDTSNFDLATGTAQFIDFSNINSPAIYTYSWGAQEGLTITDLATTDKTLVGITHDNTARDGITFTNSFDGVVNSVQSTLYIAEKTQNNAIFTPEEERIYPRLGVLYHQTNSTILSIANLQAISYAPYSFASDLYQHLGPKNYSGNEYSANTGLATVQKSEGVSFTKDANVLNDGTNPNYVTTAEESTVTFGIRYYDASQSAFVWGTSTSSFPFNTYNDIESTEEPTQIVDNGKWVAHRVYLNAPTDNSIIQYGQKQYVSFETALADVLSTSFLIDDNLKNNSVFRGWFICRGDETTTDGGNWYWFSPTDEQSDNSNSSDLPTLQKSYFGSIDVNGNANIEMVDDSGGSIVIKDSVSNTNRNTIFEIQNSDEVTLLEIDDNDGTTFNGNGDLDFNVGGTSGASRYNNVALFADTTSSLNVGDGTNSSAFASTFFYSAAATGFESGIEVGVLTSSNTNYTGLQINFLDSGNLVVTDNLNGAGLQYSSDYSSTYVTRSLVDKGYADGISFYESNGSMSGDREVYQDSNDTTFYKGSSNTTQSLITLHGDGNHSLFDPFITLHEGFRTSDGTYDQPLVTNIGKANKVQFNDGTASVDVFYFETVVNSSGTFTHMETGFNQSRHDYTNMKQVNYYFGQTEDSEMRWNWYRDNGDVLLNFDYLGNLTISGTYNVANNEEINFQANTDSSDYFLAKCNNSDQYVVAYYDDSATTQTNVIVAEAGGDVSFPNGNVNFSGEIILENNQGLDFGVNADANDYYRVRANASDTLIFAYYDDSTSTQTNLITCNTSGNVTLPNGNLTVGGNISGGNVFDPAPSMFLCTSLTPVSTAVNEINLDDIEIDESGSEYTISTTNNDITFFGADGTRVYEITYMANFEMDTSTGATRSYGVVQANLDNATVTGSESYCYIRQYQGSNNGLPYNSCSNTFMIQPQANDVLQFEVFGATESGQTLTEFDLSGATFTIKRVH